MNDMNGSFKSDPPDSSGSQPAAMLAVAVVLETGHMQVDSVQRQARQ